MKKLPFLIMLLLLVFVGCYQRGTVQDTGLYIPQRIAENNVPYADNLHSHQFDKVVELETDPYGRCYYCYSTYSVVLKSDIEIHLISQMSKNDLIFYYPDYCYLIHNKSGEAPTEEEIAALKERNDWGQPLVKDKMYSISLEKAKDLVHEEALQEEVCAYLDLDDSYGVLSNGLEIAPDGKQQLFLVNVFPRDDGKTVDSGQLYLIVYKKYSAEPIVACQSINPVLDCQEIVHAFRSIWFNFNQE